MSESVRERVRACEICQRAKVSAGRAPLKPMSAGFPMQRVGMDIVKVGLSKNGNDRLLTIIDYFTKWVELVPIPDERASTIARAFFDNWIARWGAPHTLHTDRGKNVDGRIIRTLCELLHIDKTRTTAYHPQGDGLVERFHRTLHQMLRCHLQSVSADEWECVLPECLLAYRASVSASTGYTPHFLLTGREMVLPLEVVYRVPESRMMPTACAEVLRQRLNRAFDNARSAMGAAQRRQKRAYDRKAKQRRFKRGDLVLVFVPPAALSAKQPLLLPKHQSPWTGPFRVLARLSEVTYRVRPESLDESNARTVHVNKMKRCWRSATCSRAREGEEQSEDEDGWVLV
jgi:transposase InsO family protein